MVRSSTDHRRKGVELNSTDLSALQHGIGQTQEGTPALLEFITNKERAFSIFA
jgi:hypothetical protein